ncbi:MULTISPECIES: GNAT family N-acetyltransferase [Haematobacter]|uniref:GNAT family N-acetyltransferase n=1 Tax=Haematobacter genomosp. 1 TaxID=366618 RepID=A0A212A8V2_9RHOB|nr:MULTISPECIES: GNAT family N-acetyltransferase [Haematobacter]OWJ76334.1 GNAT family N-acetyltransferase [Haematobacter genomosp. 1]
MSVNAILDGSAVTPVEPQPVIRAERLVLRPLRKSDAGLLSLYSGDRRVAEGTRAIPHPLPPGMTEAYIARAESPKRVEDVWALDGSEQGLAELLGVISLTHIDNNQSEVGYWVAPAFWNAGFASEAMAALLGANPHKSRTLFAEAFQDNPISARVLTNAGFRYLGDAEAYSIARGSNVPTWTYLRPMT